MKKTKINQEKLKARRIARRKNSTFIGVLIVLLVLITIGYASLATVLNINGTTIIKKIEWDIHFTNVQEVKRNCNVVKPATIEEGRVLLTYKIELTDLNQGYEFNVDVINAGSIDAVLSSAALGGMDAEATKYLNYSVTYKDGSPIQVGDELTVGEAKTLKVIVKYKDDLVKTDLPTEDETFELTYEMNYEQK